MLTQFAKLLDLPTSNYEGLVLKEAKAKYGGTYLKVNDEALFYLSDVDTDRIYVNDVNNMTLELKDKDVKFLSPFTPPTGLYPTPNFGGHDKHSVFIQRTAHKQWRRSFCWENYKASYKNHQTPFKVFDAINGIQLPKHFFTVVKNGVYYLDKLVGYRSDDGDVEIHPTFYQEWIDIFGDAKVVSLETFTKPKKVAKNLEELGDYLQVDMAKAHTTFSDFMAMYATMPTPGTWTVNVDSATTSTATPIFHYDDIPDLVISDELEDEEEEDF